MQNLFPVKVESPNGGSVRERENLATRYSDRIAVNEGFSRRVVSYQGNRQSPGLRWMKYKEGFSREFVSELIEREAPQSVLDPFAGICTTPLVATGHGKDAMGIEIMPVGIVVGSAIAEAANGLSADDFNRYGNDLLKYVRTSKEVPEGFAFPHVRITEGAFPQTNEAEIARSRAFIDEIEVQNQKSVFNIACLSVLEESSYTRKDGQYLRWDHRANRRLRAHKDLGPISRFSNALERRIAEISEDLDMLKDQYGGAHPDLVTGSCLEILKDIPQDSFDMVITSPPYANRYDYTRTYALELAWMGYDQEGFSSLRQQMLSATVENKDKMEWLDAIYEEDRETLDKAIRMYADQRVVREVLDILLEHSDELSNRNVVRLIEHYVFEMAVVIAELGRIIRPGGSVVMVNDNVQYHGEELPVDFVLSDFAEQVGFDCTNIWKLARGKGNSSQQMSRFGRRELRKCVYKWVRTDA